MQTENNEASERASISAAWSAETCPILNGIYFASGRVVLLDLTGGERPPYAPRVSVSAETSFDEVRSRADTQWTYLNALGSREDSSRRLGVIFGEGGFGGDGFVAVVELGTDKLIWLAFFDRSNPFVSGEFEGDVVVVVNNAGMTWRFPMSGPEKVSLDPHT